MTEIKRAKADAIEFIEMLQKLPKEDQVYLLGYAKALVDMCSRSGPDGGEKKTA